MAGLPSSPAPSSTPSTSSTVLSFFRLKPKKSTKSPSPSTPSQSQSHTTLSISLSPTLATYSRSSPSPPSYHSDSTSSRGSSGTSEDLVWDETSEKLTVEVVGMRCRAWDRAKALKEDRAMSEGLRGMGL